MSGYVGALSSQQEATLQQFKDALQDIQNKPEDTDHYYLRWLRARRFDVHKAELMFRNHMEFRKKFGLDTILEDYTPPQLFIECLTGGYFGEDLEGYPVWYGNIGNLDPKGIYRSVRNLDEVIKYSCYNREKSSAWMKKVSEEKGRLIDKVTVVMDFKNLSFQRHYHWPSLSMFKELLKTLEANNPESSRRFLFINTPSVFPFIFNIIKRVLDEQTRDKIVMFGINSNLREELQKYISLDQLPALYGGDRYEPDAECSNYIRHGGEVDPKYYLSNRTETSREEMEWAVIGRGSSHKVQHKVTEVGSTLQWEFFTADYDIAFELSLMKATEVGRKKDIQIIRPSSRAKSHIFPQSGQHKCLVAGEYMFKFENSYSWIHAKEVFYSIKVLPPDAEPDPLPARTEHTNTTSTGEEGHTFDYTPSIDSNNISHTSPPSDVFKFDNSYSWTRSKEVFYSIKVLPPDVEPEPSPAAGISHTSNHSPHLASPGGDEEDDEFFECSEEVNGQTSSQ